MAPWSIFHLAPFLTTLLSLTQFDYFLGNRVLKPELSAQVHVPRTCDIKLLKKRKPYKIDEIVSKNKRWLLEQSCRQQLLAEQLRLSAASNEQLQNQRPPPS